MRFVAIVWAYTLFIIASLADDSVPQPIVIPASEHFEGNDGPWSTFDLRVGTPEQYVRVLVSTASPESMVALSEYACTTAAFDTVPSDCAVSRGNLFDQNKSSSWLDAGTYGINQNGIGLEANLGYSQTAEFALEKLGIGLTGPSLDNQTVAGIVTAEPFYLGIFGLNNQPVNFTTLGNYSAPSFLTTLKEQNKIPSLSWSYTAGAQYRLKQVYGQLIFSGYDTSRFTENSVSFTMADDVTRDLVVALQSISYSGSTSSTILSNSIDIFIDSTDPNLWLPGDACDAFEEAFGLTLDSKSGLYLVNETHHNDLLNSNAEVTFRLSDVKLGGDAVVITLPYAAFDLTAEYPLVENNSSYYFPLKRANDSTQYTLGRTFLQEAYLSADYERKVFNVSACVWNEGAEENIVTITSSDSDSGSGGGSGGSGSSSSRSAHLGGGAIAGIVVGCVVGAGLLILALVFVILRKRRKWMRQGYAVAAPSTEPDESVLKGPVFNSAPRSSTADGSTPMSAADVSAPRSTAEYSRSNGDSPAMAAAISANATGTSAPELDGRHVKPDAELDGKEIPTRESEEGSSHPVARNPGVYELPATEVAGESSREPGPDRAHSTLGALPTFNEREEDDSPPSPFVSTLGSNWGQDDRSDTVSPSTPARPNHGTRLF